MLQTLFYIPDNVFGIPLFGAAGLIFFFWTVAALFIIGRQCYLVYGLMRKERHRGHGAVKASERDNLRLERKQALLDLAGTMAILALIGAALAIFLPSLLTTMPGSDDKGLPVRSYGVMVLLGAVVGVWLAVRRAVKRGIEAELIYVLSIWLFIGGMVGARFFYVTEYWATQFRRIDAQGDFLFWPTLKAVLNFPQGGLVIFGALIGGGVAGLLFWLRHREQPMLKIADAIAPSMALGLAIGRIGCFLNGCCFASEMSDVAWAVRFPEQSPPYMRQIEKGQLYLHGMTFEGAATKPVVEIKRVDSESAAGEAGLEPGDQIVEIRSQAQGEAQPQVVFSATEPEGGVVPDSLKDHTLGAAERALMGIRGEGTKITIVTSEKEFSWTLGKKDEIPARSLPVQPTQLYSAIDAGLLCLVLLAFDPFRKRDGEVLALMLTLHPISRFLLESIRTDEAKSFYLPFVSTGLSISQLISAMIFVVSLGLWAYIIMRKPRIDGGDLYYYYEDAEGEPVEHAAEVAEQPTVVDEKTHG